MDGDYEAIKYKLDEMTYQLRSKFGDLESGVLPINDDRQSTLEDLEIKLQEARNEFFRCLIETWNDGRNNSLQFVSEVTDENALRLVARQETEKRELQHEILRLHNKLEAKQELEMKLEDLKVKLEVMKDLDGDYKAAVAEKIIEMADELQGEIEDWEG